MLSSPILPFCQLQFDAAVAGAGFRRVARFERLELAKAGSDKAFGWHVASEHDSFSHYPFFFEQAATLEITA